MVSEHPPAWQTLRARNHEASWSPEPPPSPVRGPHGVTPIRLRASQEALDASVGKDWPLPPPPDLDQMTAPPPPRAFMAGIWSPRPEHLPLTAPAVVTDRVDPRSPSAVAQVLYDIQPVRHAADCPAHRLDSKPETVRSSSRPPSRPTSRPQSRQGSGSRATSRPTSRSASRSGSRSASRSGHRSGYSSPGSDLR
ncbi:hypothetical protein Pmani_035670 [Petrolisthes manimaculis]|uniref:Uncharacterized protein n=1 Tax=Petrolisthes manimaculis TaxID=1843537 RepID=A0AAE1NLY1_9EUCA|nr:hypothetical protein Pmani_035670 [Petrolisthes manimaculis]